MSTALVILAAGKGTRMDSDLPKVLHKVGGAPLLHHAMLSASALEPARVVVVTGHGADQVEAAAHDFDADAIAVRQAEQLGTAHAVLQAREALAGFSGDVIVLYGDTPFITSDTLEKMISSRKQNDVVVLGFDAADPGRYGRLVMQGDALKRIVEYKDASDDERAITFCNSGVICAESATLVDLLDAVGNDNASGEYYLTDIVTIANARGLSATAVSCDEAETLGINSRSELAAAEALFQRSKRQSLIEDGVIMQAPETVFLSFDTIIGRDAEIEPNVVFAPGVTVESGARIRAFSHLEGAHVSRGATVGPFARLRPGAELAEDVHIGNFVEIKNASIDEGAKVNHLTYVGDAEIGARSNVGAGTITCNYDGVMKHKTTIGRDSFIGSNTLLVAPVTVGHEAMTATGTVVTKDVPDGAMAISRTDQTNKQGFARKLFSILRAKKAKQAKG
ncbi:bifunctional UDP-N-acetylglucosamine diphosphorylase/glucosamine-1-phosphate N-acetyltransferase GlmU [Marivita sp. XM-24bin2]|jgi:bifunctional UDP-N-acetylglucosamine pyrophosphorylase/glucosamine-1-phosphate N-acetyltransferase|uniref:bifunctional UDP-N-acetylglucosamine diphosphorylase/glucosamine-1-phosphate N-acetyltransferase GlmU n=1 Tax=unclassified Marivita TaxID=2632480 RepID=UPI000D7A376C|nr:bifunctional UDP-N-acetylglucosamine diphosphorylase/glucosamine-1-phosphate N-acetyltransferase GlmU [Marivita sp. XM-24bin2]MCR9107581.1 bifunctional UDP-N-acetylglucosamine diphosphorylase/glucosamine-1-phosphate N-acetyltransferase GlmU [Paracoccaceae bacterium]PWL34845.1 MAG: bifunctional UDP-N-acetylglucosamine diphosphorylase/glucosamine-1-phosphate N-acetyltransferase GlmU [Marivita sp. XM-24bin2]